MKLCDRIRLRREELSMSQDELAKRLGYKSRSSINKIEKGQNDIPQSKIVEFAAALNTTTEYLMGFSNNDEEKNDSDFRMIQRTYKKMTPKDKEKMIKILKASFDEYFNDDNDEYNRK